MYQKCILDKKGELVLAPCKLLLELLWNYQQVESGHSNKIS